MKNYYLKFAFIVIGIFVANVANAAAQCPPQMRAEIPFDFSLGKREYKAGSYLIEKINCSTATPNVVLRTRTGKALAMVSSFPGDSFDSSRPSDVTKLLFVNREGYWRLAEMVEAGGRYSLGMRKAKSEQIASRKSRPGAERAITITPVKKGS
jgi:hypothetical protein